MRILRVACVAGLIAAAFAAGGCREHFPHSFTLAGGDVTATHAKPAEGGYYSDWDPYAATLEVMPVEQVNPVRTQHVLVATVKDKSGKPLPNRRVEWMIAEGSVGSLIEVDESGWRSSRGQKVSNTYAVTHTNNFDHVLTRGNDDPTDDVHLKAGQTWAVITSPVEGTTHVVAYAPGIYDWSKHKVFATKHWFDVAWKFPPAATNRVGTDHKLATKVMRYSDSAPLEGYHVTYKVLSGPPAMLDPGGGQSATVKTDASGMAVVTLKQKSPAAGVNEIQIDVVRPEDKQCCKPAAHIATGKTTKTWLAPAIAIKKTAPASAVVGEAFRYAIAVTNGSKVAANNVVVTDVLPDGISYVSSSPAAKVSGQGLTWSLGALAAGASRSMTVTVKASRTGKFTNCADVKADDGLAARSCADTVVARPALALTKTGPAEAIVCDEITYVITVRNTGDAPASNVRVTDNMPAGMKTVDGRQSASYNVGVLGPGQSRQVKVAARAANTGEYVNKASATADGGLSADASAKTIVRKPVLKVTKTAPARRYVGRPLEYEITVANTGDAVARDTVLVDTLPTNAEFVSASNGGRMNEGKVVWPLGNIRPGASVKVTVSLRATRQGQVKNTAAATAYCAKASAEATTDVRGIPAILLECVDLADPIEVGASETYVIVVTNQGSAPDTNIVIKCTLPPEQSFVSATAPTRETVVGQVVTFAPLKALAPKAKATYRVVVKGVKPGDVRFKVSLTSDQMTSPAEETESTRIYSD